MSQTKQICRWLGGVRPGGLGIILLGLSYAPPFVSFGVATDRDAQLQLIEQDRLRTAARSEQLQKENEAIAKEKSELQDRLVAAGRGALSQEAALMLLESEIVKTEWERLRRRDLWQKNQAYMGAMLGALERLALRPPPALLLSTLMATRQQTTQQTTPASRSADAARHVARVGIVLTSLVPLMNARAQRLQVDMLDLQALEDRLQKQKIALNQTKQSLALRREVIVQLLHRRRVLEAANLAETRRLRARMASLAQSSRSLRELAAKIEAAPPPIGRMDSNIATYPNIPKLGVEDANKSPHLIPVAGSVVMQWGQIDNYGQAARGLTLQTRPGATVIAPAHGRVLFAGPFHNYAGVLIIGMSSEYVCVITGLGQISVQIGDNVKAGEAVGIVDLQKDSLYFEVRREGKPINPMPWLKES
ncbi:MAG: peptidoglycan DD-metalloendopeptidase family protein [Alphaproteobacteria bacterium]|nr:peptidoglycan DD-metalloendopeptidase family protein [Alphaproteobacteria bacterium]